MIPVLVTVIWITNQDSLLPFKVFPLFRLDAFSYHLLARSFSERQNR